MIAGPATAAAPDRTLSLQQALRTVGLDLEAAQAPRASLMLGPAGIAVDGLGDDGQRAYSWAEVAHLAEVQQEQRRPDGEPHSWLDPWALSRWSVLLRVVGQLLDAQGLRTCTIEAAIGSLDPPQECQVRVEANGREILNTAAVREQVQWLRLRRGTAQWAAEMMQAAPPPPRPWWAFWRRG